MLHLRILVPAELTPSITSLLRREPGAVHLSIVPGAGLDPIADLSRRTSSMPRWRR